MRKTIGGILAVMAVAGGLLPVWGQSKPLYSNVPQTHWAYDALQSLLQMGFNSGIPDGTYSGRRAITRAEFATCTARIAYQGSLEAGIGWPGRPARYIHQWRHLPSTLARLATEFKPELEQLKLDGDAFQHRLQRFNAVWRDGRPLGVEAPMAPRVSYLHEDSRAEGARLADNEWERGAVQIYLPKHPRDPQVELAQALLYAVPAGKQDEHRDDLIAGHNTEMWWLLRDHAAVPKTSPGWLKEIFDLRAAWQRYGHRALKIDAQHPGAVLANTDARLIWEAQESTWLRRHELTGGTDGRLRAPRHPEPATWMLVFDAAPWTEVPQQVPLPVRPGSWELAWGPVGSGIYFARTRVRDDREMPFRLYAMDLRTGAILNAAASTD